MSELKKQNVPTAEFKAKVGLEAVRVVKTINEISQMYAVNLTQLGLWKKEILDLPRPCLKESGAPSRWQRVRHLSCCMARLGA